MSRKLLTLKSIAIIWGAEKGMEHMEHRYFIILRDKDGEYTLESGTTRRHAMEAIENPEISDILLVAKSESLDVNIAPSVLHDLAIEIMNEDPQFPLQHVRQLAYDAGWEAE